MWHTAHAITCTAMNVHEHIAICYYGAIPEAISNSFRPAKELMGRPSRALLRSSNITRISLIKPIIRLGTLSYGEIGKLIYEWFTFFLFVILCSAPDAFLLVLFAAGNHSFQLGARHAARPRGYRATQAAFRSRTGRVSSFVIK